MLRARPKANQQLRAAEREQAYLEVRSLACLQRVEVLAKVGPCSSLRLKGMLLHALVLPSSAAARDKFLPHPATDTARIGVAASDRPQCRGMPIARAAACLITHGPRVMRQGARLHDRCVVAAVALTPRHEELLIPADLLPDTASAADNAFAATHEFGVCPARGTAPLCAARCCLEPRRGLRTAPRWGKAID
jgi:hypothetical protein